MTERSHSPDPSVTLVQTEENKQQDVQTVRLRLKKPTTLKKVNWGEGTVDNEHMNKKKSKCCCQYVKPKEFDESSSESDDDECENCHGHVEKKKKSKDAHQHNEMHNVPPENFVSGDSSTDQSGSDWKLHSIQT